jgi:hypothetical protein
MALISSHLARRVAEIRQETFDVDGVPHLAERLSLPAGTWRNYEAGVIIPATVLLKFIEVTEANPGRLLNGKATGFRARLRDARCVARNGEGTAMARRITRLMTIAMRGTLFRADPDGFAGLRCLNCGSAQELNQPDQDLPVRLLGVCPHSCDK